jgi:hypothetical protein
MDNLSGFRNRRKRKLILQIELLKLEIEKSKLEKELEGVRNERENKLS